MNTTNFVLLGIIGALAASTAYFAYLSEHNRMIHQETIGLLKERGLDECYFFSLKHEGELCYVVTVDDKKYMLTRKAAEVYGIELGKEAGYKAMELRLPYLDNDAKIHLMVSGLQEEVQSFVSNYDLNIIKSTKKGTIGWVTKSGLERIISDVSMQEYVESKLDIGIPVQACDETGCAGPFEGAQISEEESQEIAKASEEYRDKRLHEIISSGDGVELIT